MRRLFVLFIALSLTLSACGTLEISLETPPPAITEPPVGSLPDTAVTAKPRLSLSSTSDEIQRAMLASATNWQTIWMDGIVTEYAPDGAGGPVELTREQVWIDLPASRFRILSGPADGSPESFKASDGLSILEMDLNSGQSQSNPLPDLGPEKQFVPALQPGFAHPQPLWGQMGTRLSQLAFSSDLAQNEGTFKPVATEFIADRETVAVEWTYIQNELPSWKLWLDAETAVILKLQNFDKNGGETVRSERVVNAISYDAVYADDLFRAPAAPPQFGDFAGNPLTEAEPAPTASSDPDPLREVYFFIFNASYGNEKTQVVRVPGSCVAGLIPCPEAEIFSLPTTVNASLPSLTWSPDGRVAAFAYPDEKQTGLFLLDPQTLGWHSLVEFNFIDPPSWSPDGEWLAFRVQDGEGSDEIYAIRRDGTQLTNLSASESLPADGSPYALSGWINNHVILQSRSTGTVYLLRPEDDSVKPLFDLPLAKSDFVIPSPDGYFLAYTDVSDQKVTLKLLTPDGSTARDLATFQGGSIYPIVWSPDGDSLAFARSTGDPSDGQDVYVIQQDGRNLQQVYHSSFGSIFAMDFSPDGNHLVFHDDNAAGRHIFVVDLSTLQQHKLQIPDLPLDWWWLAPSWR